MIRFIHTSDIHLGKPFGRFPEDVRARLRQSRQDSLDTLAQVARSQCASHILLAGDTFDAETPARTVLRHAMNAMADAADVTWVLMPGNHDHLKAAEIWDVLRRDAPVNVVLALEPSPLPLVEGAFCLPAPCTSRNPGRDLTEWYDACATGDAIRIGLAHGSIRDFRSVDEMGGESGAVIAPDRAKRAELDYLAFGDWHGRIEVASNTWYSGTPEADSFKPHQPSGVLSVEIKERGAPAKVLQVETGKIDWTTLSIDLLAGDNGAEQLRAALPDLRCRRRTMIDIRPTGQLGLGARAALEQAVHDTAPDFMWCDYDLSGLGTAHDAGDLDHIDDRGAVRDAAEALAKAADTGDEVAAAALTRLFSYAMEDK
ncbi:metallophosphoesterase family protein [Sedimentimonas flavescens]|uniref:metallophosphoesterase family protein n=1 Tax=Sedimentimonas flavescens TaxID=2851012 RepID=UPI001C4A07D0|nr:metallophosphoesterase [Sedimentimonas flavescens]MBW0157615.1 metallophosphoesterase [Sedimentimonas flavescens]